MATETRSGEPRFRWFLGIRLLVPALLLLALLDLPYAYYQMLRWVVCGTALFSGLITYDYGRTGWTLTFGAIAILFNPIAPVYMERASWAIVDVVTALLILVSFIPLRESTLRGNSSLEEGDVKGNPPENGVHEL